MQDVWTKIQADNYKIEEIGSNLAGISEIEGTDWILVSYITKSIVYSDINMVRVAMIIICIISVLLITVLIERVVNAVISPVKGLTKIITDMTNGDFTIEVPTNKNDEIGVMSNHVDKFIDAMRNMISSIYNVCNF